MTKLALILPLLFALPARAQVNEGKLITKNNYFEIPFEDTRKPINTTATIRGEQFDFMLDSGAPVFISTEMQKKYNFKVITKADAQDAGGGSIKIEIVRIDTITLGPFVFTDIPALVFDLENSAIDCFHISGNIGSNVLRHLVAQFDVENKRISLTDNATLLKKQVPETPLLRVDDQSNVFFAIKADNDVTDTVQFDTGDRELYDISKRAAFRYRQRHPNNTVRKGFGIISMGISGPGQGFTQYGMKVNTIKVGDAIIDGDVVYMAGDDMSRMGRELLSYGVLQVNYPAKTWGFQVYSTAPVPDNYDYGFVPVRDREKVYVGCCWQGSDAMAQGVRSGDQLVKVNDIDLTALPKCDLYEVLNNELHQELDMITITYKDPKGADKTAQLPKILFVRPKE